MTHSENLEVEGEKPNGNNNISFLQTVSLAVNEATTFEDALESVVKSICQFISWPLGHVYIRSKDGTALYSSGIWYSEIENDGTFREWSEREHPRFGVGAVGSIWKNGRPRTIIDINKEDDFIRKLPIKEGGIQAYYAFPIIIDEEVVAIFEFFSQKAEAPPSGFDATIEYVRALMSLILQRQQTLDRLQRSQSQLAEAQHIARLGHWEWDILNDQVFWSPELYRIFGLKPGQFEATYGGFLKYVHPEDLEYVQEKVRGAFEHGRSFDYFHRMIRSDGDERVVHARGFATYSDDGSEIIKLSGTVQDMTEHKKTEIKLSQTVRQLSAMMEIGKTVAATLALDTLFQKVLKPLAQLINADAVLLYTLAQNRITLSATYERSDERIKETSILITKGNPIATLEENRSLVTRQDACYHHAAPEVLELFNFKPNACITVPIRLGNKVVGILEALHRDALYFDDETTVLLETAAAWLAIALGNVQQYNQLQRRLTESNAIADISNAFTRTLDLEQLLQLIIEKVQEIIGHADWAAIHLLNTQNNQLELVAKAGTDEYNHPQQIELGEGFTGRAMARGGIINVADVLTDPNYGSDGADDPARALLIAPVESRINRIGTISVHCRNPSMFTEDDERLLTILGIQAGMAIDNARLYATQRKARELAEKQRRRMQQLAQRVVRAQEEERARIARELHDESGQSLTSLKISLDLIRSTLPDELGHVKESLTEVLELTDLTMSNLRLLSHNLRPPGLDVYGLHAALTGLCEDFKSHTKLDVTYDGKELPNLKPLVGLALYRFAQEALTNAIKHSQATKIQMILLEDSGMISLMIIDNGRGFDPPDFNNNLPSSGAGLVGMTERLEMVNGHLTINSSPNSGSWLTAVVPYVKDDK